MTDGPAQDRNVVPGRRHRRRWSPRHRLGRITDNWLELTVRFIVHTLRIRSAKDAMARQIVREFRTAGIGIASATYDIVELPPIEVRTGQEPKTSTMQA